MIKPAKQKRKERNARIAINAVLVIVICLFFGIGALPTVLVVMGSILLFEFIILRGISWYNGTPD